MQGVPIPITDETIIEIHDLTLERQSDNEWKATRKDNKTFIVLPQHWAQAVIFMGTQNPFTNQYPHFAAIKTFVREKTPDSLELHADLDRNLRLLIGRLLEQRLIRALNGEILDEQLPDTSDAAPPAAPLHQPRQQLLREVSVSLTILRLFNAGLGVIAAVWILIVRGWQPVLLGVIFVLASPYALGLILSVGYLLFGGIAVLIGKAGFRRTSIAIASLNVLVLATALTATCIGALMMLVSSGTTLDARLPLMLWSFVVATSPWIRLALMDEERNWSAQLTAVFFPVTCLLALALTALNADLVLITIVVLAITLAVEVALMVYGLRLARISPGQGSPKHS